MEQAGISLGDAMNLCNRGDYGYGANAMWNNPMWALAFMRFMGGGAYGWDGVRSNVATQSDVYAANDSQSMRQAVNNLGNGLADVGFSITNAIKDGNAGVTKTVNDVGAGVAKAVNDVGAGMAMGFCNIGHAIENTKYENAKNTADIITNATCNTQKILDKMCAMELNAVKAENMDLRQKLADERLASSQFAQSAYIIDKLTPVTP